MSTTVAKTQEKSAALTPRGSEGVLLAAEAGQTERGKTFVADEVISTLARVSAEQIEGIHQIGVAGLRGVLSRTVGKGGIDAEVGMKEAAVALDVIVNYGYPIRNVATQLRQQVIETIEQLASRNVVAVDINIVDVHVPKRETTKRALE